ncbi:hypothetical protein R1flu_017533 [Riccia fluitans]|uniref:Uncharacterized protein n=1 Tax=Riccia fluitans TaxID=41844 RepID=A0ABD1ZDI3_9MARC
MLQSGELQVANPQHYRVIPAIPSNVQMDSMYNVVQQGENGPQWTTSTPLQPVQRIPLTQPSTSYLEPTLAELVGNGEGSYGRQVPQLPGTAPSHEYPLRIVGSPAATPSNSTPLFNSAPMLISNQLQVPTHTAPKSGPHRGLQESTSPTANQGLQTGLAGGNPAVNPTTSPLEDPDVSLGQEADKEMETESDDSSAEDMSEGSYSDSEAADTGDLDAGAGMELNEEVPLPANQGIPAEGTGKSAESTVQPEERMCTNDLM